MSLLLKDRVWSMEAPTAKRGVYPLHGFKLGLYRLPIVLEDPNEIKSVHDGLKKAFEMDKYADRIYATYRWKEQNMEDPDEKGYEEVDLSVTVEIVTGEVVDIIYQVFPIEKFGDPNWVKDYRKKADHFAKMVIDTILRNTILADKMISYLAKSEKITEPAAIQRLEELTPLAKIVLGAKPKPIEATDEEEEEDDASIEIPDGAKPGPIDVDYKSKMKPSAVYEAAEHTIKTWGRKGTSSIEACPVGVYEWFDSPGNPASDKKPLMSKEPDCIFCLACEGVCPPQAIKIYEQK